MKKYFFLTLVIGLILLARTSSVHAATPVKIRSGSGLGYQTPTFVQTVATSTQQSTSTATITTGVSVAAGHTLVVTAVASVPGFQTPTLTGVVDSNGNTYTVDVSKQVIGTSAVAPGLSVASAYMTTALTSTSTVTLAWQCAGCGAASPGTSTIQLSEYSGLASTNWTDQTAKAGVASQSQATGITSGVTAYVGSPKLVLGYLGVNSSTQTISAGSGYTMRAQVQSPGSTGYVSGVEDKVTTTGGVQTCTGSWAGSDALDEGAACVVYKAAARTTNNTTPSVKVRSGSGLGFLTPTFVQTVSTSSGQTSGGGANHSITVTVGNAVTAGNTLIVSALTALAPIGGGAILTGVTDTQGNTYTVQAGSTLIGSSVTPRFSLASAYITTALTSTSTLTLTWSCGGCTVTTSSVQLTEYSNLSNTSRDQVASSSAKAQPQASGITSGATAPTSPTTELVVGALAVNSSTQTLTAGSGYTMRTQFQEAGASLWTTGIEDKVITTGGSQTCTGSWAGSDALNEGAICVTYRAAGKTGNNTVPSVKFRR